jgi:hypothetical protein
MLKVSRRQAVDESDLGQSQQSGKKCHVDMVLECEPGYQLEGLQVLKVALCKSRGRKKAGSKGVTGASSTKPKRRRKRLIKSNESVFGLHRRWNAKFSTKEWTRDSTS